MAHRENEQHPQSPTSATAAVRICPNHVNAKRTVAVKINAVATEICGRQSARRAPKMFPAVNPRPQVSRTQLTLVAGIPDTWIRIGVMYVKK